MAPKTATAEAQTATRLNWSTLKHMATSPKLLKLRREHPMEETPALILGRAIHCLVLEPQEFDRRWTVAGKCPATVKTTGNACGSQGSLYFDGAWFCRVKGHAPAGAGPLPAGMEVIPDNRLDTVQACAAALREHPVAARVLKNGLAEHALEWTNAETGILCRGRLDYLKPNELVDLKSGWGETVRDIVRSVATRLYYAQLAWYHDGAIAAGWLQPDAPLPLLVHVQTDEPYDVAVFRLSSATYEAGKILYRELLTKFRDCTAADEWPGIAPDQLKLEVPEWAMGMRGSDYEGGVW